MMKTTTLTLLLTAMGTTAFGYVQLVHVDFSRAAFNRATVNFRRSLGMEKDLRIALREATARGADEEDNFPRSAHHFFDPVHGAPLEVPFLQCAPLFLQADQWALLPSRYTENAFALSEAKNKYVKAVVGSSAVARVTGINELFTDLGHSIHLIQDMAQPEHTRNDQHLYGFGDIEASIWEDWGRTNLVVNSRYGTPTVPYEGYPNVSLPRYEDYFHTFDGRGMADFSRLLTGV